MIIILVDNLIPVQWSNTVEVTWLVLLAAWWLNLYPQIIATVLTETLSSALILPLAGCMQIGVIDLIPKGGYSTSNCPFHRGFCQTFASDLSRRLPTTPKKGNSCSCGAVTLAGIVKSGES
jgi:hypothetical protein